MKRLAILAGLAAAIAFTSALAFAAHHEKKAESKKEIVEEIALAVGDKAPVFEILDQDGKAWKSAGYVGKGPVVVYFYPAAMTGGCTKQACSYRDMKEALVEEGITVVGVSGDDPSGLKLFQKANNINFALLSDPDGAVAKQFGVPLRDGGSIQRTLDGEEFTLTRGVTAMRWTFVIGKDGKILYKNSKVNAEADASQVMAVVKGVSPKGEGS